MGPALLSPLSLATAGQYGVTLQAEAVANNKHTLYLIAEAGDEQQLWRYLAPFAQAGSVEVLPASPLRGGYQPRRLRAGASLTSDRSAAAQQTRRAESGTRAGLSL
jgi:hypothetical protein